MITYENLQYGKFVERKNRFIAQVEIHGKVETVHVKNTGRCRELFLPGAKVSLQHTVSPARKTAWDLIAVEKEGLGWVNVDSQVPNKVVEEWLQSGQSPLGRIDFLKPEYVYGNSRVDFYAEIEKRRVLLEVKGCTLEIGGTGFFPDAPTERGAKHLRELARACREGYETYLVYCIAMNGIDHVEPNTAADPGYGKALEEARSAGVKVVDLRCRITAASIEAQNYAITITGTADEENND